MDRHALFIRDIVYALRERAAAAARENGENGSPFARGRKFAFREVLAMMQNQADTFLLPRDEINLDGFDALLGAVDPPRPPRR